MKTKILLRKSLTECNIHILLCMLVLFLPAIINNNLYAQKHESVYSSATVQSKASVCIVSMADLNKPQIQIKEEVKNGYSNHDVTDILGYPNQIVKMKCGNKEKWIYDDKWVYLEDNVVKIILPIKPKNTDLAITQN